MDITTCDTSTITLKKGEAAIIFKDNDAVEIFIPECDQDEPVSDNVMLAMVCGMVLHDQEVFNQLHDKLISKMEAQLDPL
jgi:hypothetical protein